MSLIKRITHGLYPDPYGLGPMYRPENRIEQIGLRFMDARENRRRRKAERAQRRAVGIRRSKVGRVRRRASYRVLQTRKGY